MNKGKTELIFSGNINTRAIAELTSLFSRYRLNIMDINMIKSSETGNHLVISCQSCSTTDEIDSFWNDLNVLSEKLNISYSKKYV